jgi:hypothetical protein
LRITGPERSREQRLALNKVDHLFLRQHPGTHGAMHTNNVAQRGDLSAKTRVGCESQPVERIASDPVDIRWQPHVIRVLGELQADPERDSHLPRIADTIADIENELPLGTGAGDMWIVPINGTDWVLVCNNNEPNVVVITYLGPALT